MTMLHPFWQSMPIIEGARMAANIVHFRLRLFHANVTFVDSYKKNDGEKGAANKYFSDKATTEMGAEKPVSGGHGAHCFQPHRYDGGVGSSTAVRLVRLYGSDPYMAQGDHLSAACFPYVSGFDFAVWGSFGSVFFFLGEGKEAFSTDQQAFSTVGKWI